MDTPSLITLLNVTALVTIMLSMGLQVKFEDVLASARPARRLVLGLLANYVLVPAVTLGLLYVFQANPMVSVGFFILAVCPGAPIGPPITAIARGDVPWAIGMMLILAGLSALLSPALLSVLSGPDCARDCNVTHQLSGDCPDLADHSIAALWRWVWAFTTWRQVDPRIVKPVGLLANALLLALVGLIVATQYETLAAIRLRGWTGMSLLLLASLGIGWLCGGPDSQPGKQWL